jgi:hypothetical protein
MFHGRMEMTTQRETGLTWRSILALLFTGGLVQPLIIYLALTGATGLIELSLIGFGGGFGAGYTFTVFTNLGMTILWLVVIFWSELAKLSNQPLSKQEVFIIYTFYPITISMSLFFINPIFKLYLANSVIVEDLGLAKGIPSWWAPRSPISDLVYQARSLLHPGLLVPIGLSMIVVLLTLIADISLGLFTYYLFFTTEKLEFPGATTIGIGLETVASGDQNRLRMLMLFSVLGLVYNFFSWLFPTVTNIPVFRVLPRGLIDFTSLLEAGFPGAVFGIDMTLTNFALGFVIPLKVLVTMAIVALLSTTIGNICLVKYNIWPDWIPGLGLGWNYMRSHIYFWTSVTMGLSIAAATIPLLLHPQILLSTVNAIRRAASSLSEGVGGVNPYLLLIMFVGSMAIAIVLFHVLVPEFPLWLLIAFTVGWSLIGTLVGVHAAGITFGGLSIPYLKESMIYYSGYRGLDAWFGRELIILSTGGIGICNSLVSGTICGVRVRDYLKGYLVAIFIATIFGFVYTSLFWKAAAIPSHVYPFTISGWPVIGLETARLTKWLWMGFLFKTDIIIGSLVFGSLIYLVSDLIFHSPWLLISIVAGLNTLPSVVLTQLIGGLIGKFIGLKFIGVERWRILRSIIIIGLIVGDAVGLTIGTVIQILNASSWTLPY